MLKKKEEEPVLFTVNTEYHKHLNSEEKGRKKTSVFRMPRGRRFIIAFAAVLVLVVGTSVTSVGSKSYLKILWEKIHGGQTMQVMNVEDMETQDSEDGEEVTAYGEIRERLGVVAVRIGSKPKGMYLSDYTIDEEQKRAQLFYTYEDEIIRYSIYLNNSDSSLSQKEEDTLIDEFVVETSHQEIDVKKYKKSNQDRFVAKFDYQGVYYQIKGVMDEDEFKGILNSLIFFE